MLNHAGLPLPGELDGWRAAMAELAKWPNVMVKISGLGNLDSAGKREVIQSTIELFGTQRAMFASNYPVDSLRHRFYAEFEEAARSFSPEERAGLFHDNAVRIYRME